MELAEQIPWQYRVSTENTKLAMRKAALKAAPPKTANKKSLASPCLSEYGSGRINTTTS